MKIFVLNSGSSSIKFQVIETDSSKTLIKGICERIGNENSTFTVENVEKKLKRKNEPHHFKNHTVALEHVLKSLLDKEIGVVKKLDEIEAIGHRIVHGGEWFTKSTIVTDEVLKTLELANKLAPLHNPANIKGVMVCKRLMPNKTNVLVFDTAFHHTLEPEKYIYAIPYEDYEELNIRKYGFHGTSVRYVSKKAISMLGNENSKIIVCHLGNGASITAVKDGKSIDTSMGFTPLSGIPMGTRSGDIDPAIILYLMEKRHLSRSEAMERLNKKSGMLGIFGKSDNRDLTFAMLDGDKKAKLAFDIFCSKIVSYIGSYYVQLGGLDAIIFTGGIGENSHETREEVCKRLEVLGVELDLSQNAKRVPEDLVLSTENSKVKVFKISTNEELVIAKDVEELINK